MLFSMVAFIESCKKDNDPISGEVSQTVSNEATQDSQQDEVDDVATNQLNTVDPEGQGFLKRRWPRFLCLHSPGIATSNKETGSITINFDKNANGEDNPDGCTDARRQCAQRSDHHFMERRSLVQSRICDSHHPHQLQHQRVVINGNRQLSNVTARTHPLIPT